MERLKWDLSALFLDAKQVMVKNEKGGIPIFKFPDAYREPERRALWIAKGDCANWEPKKTDDIGP